MALAQGALESTNGRNGHSVESDARKVVAVMAIVGSISDAQSVYLSLPGTGLEDWSEFERSVLPLRRFVQDGETPYVRMFPVAEYQGTPTPEGDCVDDALPLEARNVARAKIRAMMVGDTYPEQQKSTEDGRIGYEIS